MLDVVGVDGDLEIGPEPLQVVGVDRGRGLMFEDVVVIPDPHDPVDLAGQHEAAGRRAGRRVDDRALEGLFQGHDRELLARVAARRSPS